MPLNYTPTNTIIEIRGIPLIVTDRVLITSGKNFGKSLYTLRDGAGNTYSALGKTLTKNSKLSKNA